jgi:hypothetical protein
MPRETAPANFVHLLVDDVEFLDRAGHGHQRVDDEDLLVRAPPPCLASDLNQTFMGSRSKPSFDC